MLMIIPPQSPGEWLAWASAFVTFGFGLVCFLMPRLSLRILRLQTRPDVPEAAAESRATMAGFYLATSLASVAFDQPFVWMVLGAGWAFTALGRLISMIFDRGFTAFNLLAFALEIALAAGPLLFALGIVA